MTAGPELAGTGVRLRGAGDDDVGALLALFADPAVQPWWKAHDEARVRELLADEDDTGWVVEHDGAVVGWIQAWEEEEPDFRHATIDVATTSAVHGRGVGPEAIALVRDWLVAVRGHHRVTIDPAVDNTRAVRAYERLGFRPVGVMRRYERTDDGSWRDGLLMEWVAGLDGR